MLTISILIGLLLFTPQEFLNLYNYQHSRTSQVAASRILNHELAEYTTKCTIYTPSGDKIIFK